MYSWLLELSPSSKFKSSASSITLRTTPLSRARLGIKTRTVALLMHTPHRQHRHIPTSQSHQLWDGVALSSGVALRVAARTGAGRGLEAGAVAFFVDAAGC